jgi:hypothetical protein
MPAAALPFISAGIGGAGAISSGIGGKKAQKKQNELAQQQLGLQRDQYGTAQKQLGMGNQAIAPAQGYFNALLQGGQAAREAVGPYASLISQAGQGTNNAILAGTPRGGEQNLAIAQNRMNTGNQIAGLYKGMQPLAAEGLTGIGSQYLSSGAAFNPNPNIGGAFGAYGQQQQNAQQAGQGFGNILYAGLNKLQQGKGGRSVSPGAYGTALGSMAGGIPTISSQTPNFVS